MDTKFDTAGQVSTTDRSFWGGYIKWSDLSPFAQGYVDALLSNLLVEREIDRKGQTLSESYAAFSDLAPETLARIIADCEAAAPIEPRAYTIDGLRQMGADLWRRSPLTVQLGDDGKVRFAA